ncbi:MAG TPA: crosslink repair DNA glycosylase YcaQ family protein [Gemmatimonadaceae bacterium]|nr:crosslink repair DNA glycosylase YcaQ family protein [Gemmatimonadaceae bacterium]
MLSLPDARRIALAAQGFDRPRPAGRVDARHLRRVVRQLGLLQIDYVNVLAPAHYVVPFSRLGPYERSLLDDLVYRRRELAEQWAHEASLIPAETWPLLRHRMLGEEGLERRWQAMSRFMAQHADYAQRVLDEVRARGPLTADELPEPDGTRGTRRGSWWGWTHAKATLEGHFARGRLAIAGRRAAGSARAYDLAERVIPAEHRAREMPPDEAQRALLRAAAGALGVGTAADLADYYRMPIRAARPRIAELVEAGELRPALVDGWAEPAYLHPAARRPRRIDAAALLSPFDPVVWYRPRAARLFGFDYRIEIYTPRPQRRWGYYVLPFLLGDRLAARVDLKADRAAGRLLVHAAYAEPDVDAEEVAAALAAELRTMASWLGLDDVSVARKGDLARALIAAARTVERGRGMGDGG